MQSHLIDSLNESLRHCTGRNDKITRLTGVAGGSISRAMIAETERKKYFIKLNDARFLEMFEAEADGLRALGASPSLRVPRVIGHDSDARHALLILEYIDMRPLSGKHAHPAGQALAKLHAATGDCFGWHRNNFIGSTPQSNSSHADWPDFFAHERLLPQLALASKNGHAGSFLADGERLAAKLRTFFKGYQPTASLLHGDLWSGNAAIDEHGKLVLFDPAAYFGDREADLAMTHLFGGFPQDFYAAYEEALPLAAGHEQRKTLYNLYHVLNHLNLFGGSYRHEAEHMIGKLLAEIG